MNPAVAAWMSFHPQATVILIAGLAFALACVVGVVVGWKWPIK